MQPSATTEQPEKGLDVSTVPASLKTDGYQYYGLEQLKPVEFEIRSENREMSGSSTSSLKSVKNAVAVFSNVKTGDLAGKGDEELEARPDGVYSVKIGSESVKPPQLVMPAKVPAGMSWKTKNSVKLSDGTVYVEDLMNKIVGPEKVKTKAGAFDALKVSAKGKITQGKIANKAEMTAWFVKNVGLVKMSITFVDPKGKVMRVTQEATKVE